MLLFATRPKYRRRYDFFDLIRQWDLKINSSLLFLSFIKKSTGHKCHSQSHFSQPLEHMRYSSPYCGAVKNHGVYCYKHFSSQSIKQLPDHADDIGRPTKEHRNLDYIFESRDLSRTYWEIVETTNCAPIFSHNYFVVGQFLSDVFCGVAWIVNERCGRGLALIINDFDCVLDFCRHVFWIFSFIVSCPISNKIRLWKMHNQITNWFEISVKSTIDTDRSATFSFAFLEHRIHRALVCVIK